MSDNHCPKCGAFTSTFDGTFDMVDCNNCNETFFLSESGKWFYYLNNKRRKYVKGDLK